MTSISSGLSILPEAATSRVSLHHTAPNHGEWLFAEQTASSAVADSTQPHPSEPKKSQAAQHDTAAHETTWNTHNETLDVTLDRHDVISITPKREAATMGRQPDGVETAVYSQQSSDTVPVLSQRESPPSAAGSTIDPPEVEPGPHRAPGSLPSSNEDTHATLVSRETSQEYKTLPEFPADQTHYSSAEILHMRARGAEPNRVLSKKKFAKDGAHKMTAAASQADGSSSAILLTSRPNALLQGSGVFQVPPLVKAKALTVKGGSRPVIHPHSVLGSVTPTTLPAGGVSASSNTLYPLPSPTTSKAMGLSSNVAVPAHALSPHLASLSTKMATSGGGSARITLHPEHLGSITLNISLTSDGAVNVHMMAEKLAGLDAATAAAAGLTQHLIQAGFQVAAIQTSQVSGGATSQFSDGGTASEQNRHQQQHQASHDLQPHAAGETINMIQLDQAVVAYA